MAQLIENKKIINKKRDIYLLRGGRLVGSVKFTKPTKIVLQTWSVTRSYTDPTEENQKIVGYDNEKGKGDHKHIKGTEYAYEFIDIETLWDDFITDISEVENND